MSRAMSMEISPIGPGNAQVMNRFELTKRLVAKLPGEEAVIGGIGNTNFDLWAAGHRPQNFYMLGSMGLACPIALGVALAQPQRHVVALEGDGSLLMQLGTLATIATLKPKNLTIIVMDNRSYQITGAQPTANGCPSPTPRSMPSGATPCCTTSICGWRRSSCGACSVLAASPSSASRGAKIRCSTWRGGDCPTPARSAPSMRNRCAAATSVHSGRSSQP